MAANENIVPVEISRLQAEYRGRREQALLDAAAASLSMHSILTADAIDFDAITPQMRESFTLAFPGKDLNATLSEIASHVNDDSMVTGYLSAWRGKYFEVLVRDELNAGEHLGDLFLLPGQTAVLAEDLSQPGWDLQIVSDGGLPVSDLQLKATDSVAYVNHALEKYPDIHVLATDEVADQIASGMVASSEISNSALEGDV